MMTMPSVRCFWCGDVGGYVYQVGRDGPMLIVHKFRDTIKCMADAIGYFNLVLGIVCGP